MSNLGKKFFLVGEVILVCLVWMTCIYLVISYYFHHDLIVHLAEVSGSTIGRRIGMDLLLCLPAFLTLAVFYGTIKGTLCIERENKKICLLAALFLPLSFFICQDVSLRGLYIFLYNVIIVSFAEEVVFRGYIYQRLKKVSVVLSFFVTGCIFGIFHAIVPAVLNGSDWRETFLNMVGLLGWGIIFNGIFVYFLASSHTLFVPVVIHAMGDYFIEYGHTAYTDMLYLFCLGCFIIKDVYVHKKQIINFFTKPTEYL